MPETFTTESQSFEPDKSAIAELKAFNLSPDFGFESAAGISEETIRVLQAIPAGILFVDRTGVIVLANKSARSIFEVNLKGRYWRDVIKDHFRPQKDDGFELSLINGRKVKFSISKIEGTPGQLIQLTDLTETRLLQSKVAHMQRLSSLGKMVASLAHQLRTPLSAAMLYAANICNRNATEQGKSAYAEKLSKRLIELESQINDMLLFAKSGGGSFLDDISIVALSKEIISESRETWKDTTFVLNLERENSDKQFRGNLGALKGALQNIIQNAVFAKANEVRMQVKAEDTGFKIQISDNGPGIPPNLINKIFTPFFTTKSQGTGLGLAVVASVIKSHKGQVEVRNQKSGGALFEICLPPPELNKDHKNNSQNSFNAMKSKEFAGEIA